MANPTFDGTNLTTHAPAERIEPPRPRIRTETLPGVRGEFAQIDAPGGCDIVITGILQSPPAATVAAAQSAFKQNLRARQAKVADRVRTYVGADGHACGSCVLTSYRLVGPIRYLRAAGNYQAVAHVRAVVRNLDP